MHDPTESSDHDRRSFLAHLAGGALAFGPKGIAVVGLFTATNAAIALPAMADQKLDIEMLQTASSLELLIARAYRVILDLPFVSNDNPFFASVARTTAEHHDQHRRALQDRTNALGAAIQTAPNERYSRVLEDARPGLNRPQDVVRLVTRLEQVLTETYLSFVTLLVDSEARSTLSKIMGAEAEHLAILRIVATLLDVGQAPLAKTPLGPDVFKLPAAVGDAAIPLAFQGTEMASSPDEGAIH